MALTLKQSKTYNKENMSKKFDINRSLVIEKICFGQHGQTSVILQQIRYYFLCKNLFTDSEQKALLSTICYNVKHFLQLSEGQKFISYEKNTYEYYRERICKAENAKKVFLDVLASQTLLTKEYECLLKNNCTEFFDKLEWIILESKQCENAIKMQIKV